MKKLLLITGLVIASSLNSMAQEVSKKIGNNPTIIAPSAVLEVESTNKGVLVPRVALTGTADATTIASPATSLLVYNTATAGTSPNDVTPGYYYWTGTAWTRFTNGTPSADWKLTGNAGTTAGTNFIGTTDAIDFITKTNNTERLRVSSAGNVGIGNISSNPTHTLSVGGSARITNTPTATPTDNVILRYTDGELRQMTIAKLLGQLDTDGDGIVDELDPDIDGDGFLNTNDNCDYQYGCSPNGCPATCSGSSTAAVTMDCPNSGFSCAPIFVGSTGTTVTFKVINNSFSTVGPIDFSSSVTLSGAGAAGLTVTAGQNSSVTIASGATATLTYTLAGSPTTAGTLTAAFVRLGLSCTVNSIIYSTTGGNGLNGLSAANANFSCNNIKQAFPASADGVYWIDPDGACTTYGAMQAQCDMTTDGGGWTLIVNYVHASGTDPLLQTRNYFPLIGSSTLGTDESANSTYWGNTSSNLNSKILFNEVRIYGKESTHSRVVDFKTSLLNVKNIVMGTGSSIAGINASYTPLPNHTAIYYPNTVNLSNSSSWMSSGWGQSFDGSCATPDNGYFIGGADWTVDANIINHSSSSASICGISYTPASTIQRIWIR